MDEPICSTVDWSRISQHAWLGDGEHHVTIDSTNLQGLRALQSTEPLKTPYLIVANQQTRGKGRGNHVWHSSSGALTFSVIWQAEGTFLSGVAPVSLLVGTAVCRALEASLPQETIGLKWPNDVFVRQRKAAGILIEAAGSQPRRFVIGIGINVNNSLADAPADVQARAISLRQVTQQPLDPTDVLLHVLDQLRELLTAPWPGTELPWDKYCLLRGRTVRIRTPQGEVLGRCQGTQSDGALLLVNSSHRNQIVYSGEVISFDPAF